MALHTQTQVVDPVGGTSTSPNRGANWIIISVSLDSTGSVLRNFACVRLDSTLNEESAYSVIIPESESIDHQRNDIMSQSIYSLLNNGIWVGLHLKETMNAIQTWFESIGRESPQANGMIDVYRILESRLPPNRDCSIVGLAQHFQMPQQMTYSTRGSCDIIFAALSRLALSEFLYHQFTPVRDPRQSSPTPPTITRNITLPANVMDETQADIDTRPADSHLLTHSQQEPVVTIDDLNHIHPLSPPKQTKPPMAIMTSPTRRSDVLDHTHASDMGVAALVTGSTQEMNGITDASAAANIEESIMPSPPVNPVSQLSTQPHTTTAVDKLPINPNPVAIIPDLVINLEPQPMSQLGGPPNLLEPAVDLYMQPPQPHPHQQPPQPHQQPPQQSQTQPQHPTDVATSNMGAFTTMGVASSDSADIDMNSRNTPDLDTEPGAPPQPQPGAPIDTAQYAQVEDAPEMADHQQHSTEEDRGDRDSGAISQSGSYVEQTESTQGSSAPPSDAAPIEEEAGSKNTSWVAFVQQKTSKTSPNRLGVKNSLGHRGGHTKPTVQKFAPQKHKAFQPTRTREQIARRIGEAIAAGRTIFMSYNGGKKPRIPRGVQPTRWDAHPGRDKAFYGIPYRSKTGNEAKFFLRLIEEVRDRRWRWEDERNSPHNPFRQQQLQQHTNGGGGGGGSGGGSGGGYQQHSSYPHHYQSQQSHPHSYNASANANAQQYSNSSQQQSNRSKSTDSANPNNRKTFYNKQNRTNYRDRNAKQSQHSHHSHKQWTQVSPRHSQTSPNAATAPTTVLTTTAPTETPPTTTQP